MRKLLAILLLLAAPVFAEEIGNVVRIIVAGPDGRHLPVEVTGWKISYETNDYSGAVISINVGTNGILTSGRVVCNEADIEASSPYRGLILTATNSSKYVVCVDNDGGLLTQLIASSPEIPFTNRISKIKDDIERRSQKRISSKKEAGSNINIDTNNWILLSTNLVKTIKVATNDRLWINATLYGKASNTKTLRTSLFVNGENEGKNNYGLAYTDSTNVVYIGFSHVTQPLTNGTYTIDLRVRGKGSIMCDDVDVKMVWMVVEQDW